MEESFDYVIVGAGSAGGAVAGRLSEDPAASVLLLDLAIWAQHALFHWLPILWRLHRMHHADLDVDVTTGIRFHPLEILLSLFIKFAVVTALGAPALAVVIFEVLLNLSSMFNHANIRLAPRLDRIARLLVVTPDMHRVHHSISRLETDSNFGFNFPWWDRLFGTFEPEGDAVVYGLTKNIETFEPARIATHEAGHAVVAHIVGEDRKLEVLSIIKRSDALGLLAHSEKE